MFRDAVVKGLRVWRSGVSYSREHLLGVALTPTCSTLMAVIKIMGWSATP